MKPALIDTDILSLFFRDHRGVRTRFEVYLLEHSKLYISIITYYEILSGLKHRDTRKYLTAFLEFASCNTVLPLTEHSVTVSAEIYTDLRTKGMLIADMDILIAGIAIANDLVLVTHNQKDFGRIEGLEVEDWLEG